MTSTYTALMCVYTAAHLPPLYQGYIRSAGSTGQQVYEELVSLRCVPLYIELNPRPTATTTTQSAYSSATTYQHFFSNNDDDDMDISSVISSSRYHAPVVKSASRPDMSDNDALVFNVDTQPAHRGLSLNAVKDICRRLHHPRNLKIINGENLVGLHDYFMENCNSLVTLEGLVDFRNISKIGHSFMYGCTSLKKLNTTSVSDNHGGGGGMRNVETIGTSFMRNCARLEKVDLNALFGGGAKLVSIGKDFMSDCVDLRSVTMPASLTNITVISSNFMMRCRGLESLSLKNLVNVVTIESGFLSECGFVGHVELDGLVHLSNIGASFMSDCIQLASLFIHRDAAAARETGGSGNSSLKELQGETTTATTEEEEGEIVDVAPDFLACTTALTAERFYTDIPCLKAQVGTRRMVREYQ